VSYTAEKLARMDEAKIRILRAKVASHDKGTENYRIALADLRREMTRQEAEHNGYPFKEMK
jgi:hypothetical protein